MDDKSKTLGNWLVIGGAVSVTLAVVNHNTTLISGARAVAAAERERCYGVVRAGSNDCGSASHACASRAVRDGDAGEWVNLPRGLCERLKGGKLKPDGST